MTDIPAPTMMRDGMARPTGRDMLGWIARGEVGMAIGVIGVILLLILPIPVFLMDVLLAVSLVSSVLILMTAVMMKKPLDFAIFPTVLLVSTLFRLGLNLASTRLVLSHGHEGPGGAGQVIEAFGALMMGGSFIIGIIIFAIILVVNFVVITKGSTRIAEVSARFTLDSMPGKQMAIDADLSSGLIDEDTAKRRRTELEQESTFFGAMDGASKFVRGDAVAGLIIVFINAIGGILIGTLQHGMSIGDAANSYVALTVGDGLVTQVPAIIISIAAGFLVSKAGVEGTADKALVAQLATNPVSLGVVSAAAGLIGLIPGMPLLPFAALALGAGFMAWRLGRNRLKPVPTEGELAAAAGPKEDVEEPIGTALAIDEVKIELGYSLLSLINDLEGRRLTDQVRALRRSLAQEYGFVMPSVRILDNMRLGTQGYAIRIKEMEAGTGEVRLGSLMAMDPAGRQVELPGEHTKEPAFGLPATWIDESLREEATFRGYTIVDPSTVLTTHLTEILKDNMADLLTYAEVQKLLRELGTEEKKLVEELIPSVVTVTTLQRVLQSLLREKVSIRDLGAILEGLAEAAPHTSSVTTLVEHVRGRLARQLCWQHKGDDGALPIVTLSPDWEAAFAEALIGQGEDRQLAMAPSRLQDFIRAVRDVFERAAMAGETAVLLTGPQIRPYVRSIIERFRPQIRRGHERRHGQPGQHARRPSPVAGRRRRTSPTSVCGTTCSTHTTIHRGKTLTGNNSRPCFRLPVVPAVTVNPERPPAEKASAGQVATAGQPRGCGQTQPRKMGKLAAAAGRRRHWPGGPCRRRSPGDQKGRILADGAEKGPTPAPLAPATRKKYPSRFVRPVIATLVADGWIVSVRHADPAAAVRYWITYRVTGPMGFATGGFHSSVMRPERPEPRTAVGTATGAVTGVATAGLE